MLLTVTIATVLLSACKIENQGPMGPSGADGYANIKIVNFDIFYNDWLRDNSELNYWYYDYTTNLVDYYVIDHGAVLFYYGYIENDNNVNKWYIIPFTNVYYDVTLGRNFEKIYDASFSYGKLEIEIRDKNTTRFNWPDDRNVRVKAVILEGTQYNILKNKNVDIKDYNSVARELKINDSNKLK
jgi:hypothetical protein